MPTPPTTQPGDYRPQSPDTDEATERYLIERLRALPPWRKAEMLSASTRAACAWPWPVCGSAIPARVLERLGVRPQRRFPGVSYSGPPAGDQNEML